MTEFELFLADLDRIDGCQRTMRRVRRLLQGYAGRTLYVSRAPLIEQERKALVRKLMGQPEASRAEIVRALADRWGISVQMARDWVRRAAQP